METGRSSAASKPGTGPVPRAKENTYTIVKIRAMGPTTPESAGKLNAPAMISMDKPWPMRLTVSNCLQM